jgi:hypothetical protein
MADRLKALDKLRRNPNNSLYRGLTRAVTACGFVKTRQRGSHELYDHPEHPELRLNLQPIGTRAKPYQVHDFLKKVREYNLADG